MLIVPVLDLKGGRAVHAVRGERTSYAPTQSILAGDGDALELARAYRDRLDCGTCYVADLDAIAGELSNRHVLRDLVKLGTALWVDAGVTTVRDACELIDMGVQRVIVGSESLDSRGRLAALAANARPHSLVLSLDQQDGRLRAPSGIADAEDLISAAIDAGIRDVILLDLARVGAGVGPPLALLESLRGQFPDVAFFAGGGVRDQKDLDVLARAGARGALVATALHQGVLAATDLQDFER